MLATLLRFRKAIFCFVSCCVLVALCIPSLSDALNSGHRVPVAYDVFFEDTPVSSISQIAAPEFSNVFTPLDQTPIPYSVKRVWIRISIPIEQIERWRMNGFFPFMQFGGLVRRPTTLFYQTANNSQRWQSSTISRCHIPLPDASKARLAEYYLRVEGKPGLWFTPEITLQNSAMPTFVPSLLFWLLIGLTLGIAGLNFFLAVFTKAESCFWLCVYTLLTTTYYTFGFSPSTAAGLEFSTAWTILLPGLALIILPHIGRNLFYNAECPRHINALLWGLSLLGLLVSFFPLIPGCSSSQHYLSLWPTLAVLGIIPGCAAISQKIPGGKRFTTGCLLTALGGLLALLPANTADIAGILQLMPFAGVAMGLMIFTPIALHGSELHAHSTIDYNRKHQDFTPGKIIHKISHDLQSPLTTIARMGEKLRDINIPKEGEHALRTLQSATHVLQLQLKDLLDLNRADNNRLTLQKNSFDLQRMVKDAYHIMLPHTEEKGLSLTWEIAPNLPVNYIGDPNRLIQILLNLLGNAVRFSNAGKIGIYVSSLRSSEETVQLLFSVKDQGRGIPLQNKYDVMERFCQEPEQNSGKYCGSGLGLSVTAELVHLMDGFLCIESEPNIGTTVSFTIRLERFDKAARDYPSAIVHHSLQKSSSNEQDKEAVIPQLLIIETRSAPSESIQENLDPDVFHAHKVTSFDEAITTYEAANIDAVIVAAELTEDSITILSQLLEVDKNLGSPSTPAIAIANSPVSAELLCDSGYAEALPTPVSKTDLLAALKNLGLYNLPLEVTEPIDQDTEETNDEYEDNFEEIDDVPELEHLSLSGLDIVPEPVPEPEPEPINLLPENIVQKTIANEPVEDIPTAPSASSSGTKASAEIAYELQKTENDVDSNPNILEPNEPPKLLSDKNSESLSGEVTEKKLDSSQAILTDNTTEESVTAVSDFDVDEDTIDLHDEYIFEELEEPSAEESKFDDTSLPTPQIITPEEEAYLKEILGGNAGMSKTEDEETPARDDIPLTEAVSHLTLNSEEAGHPAEVLDTFFLPQIPKIISQLQETFEEISIQLEKGSLEELFNQAEKLQQHAQKYALREVNKMASCVARAAEAKDPKAISNLMAELETTVVQTGKALRNVYKHSSSTDDR